MSRDVSFSFRPEPFQSALGMSTKERGQHQASPLLPPRDLEVSINVHVEQTSISLTVDYQRIPSSLARVTVHFSSCALFFLFFPCPTSKRGLAIDNRVGFI